MARNRFLDPEVTILKLSDGDTLTVKRRLNAGEQRAAFARMATAGVDGTMRVNPLQVGLSTILAYLVDWSFTDKNGNLVEIQGKSPEDLGAAIDALDPESFDEVKNAIEAHDVAVRKAREHEKKVLAGAKESSAISPSPADVTGDTSGSPS